MSKSQKGGAWEREFSKFLTKWLTGQTKDYYFWRSPGSGSVATVNLGNKAISGDIIALKPEAIKIIDIFSIECKNGYKGISLDKHLKDNKTDGLLDFWNQCNKASVDANKEPMLIYKKQGQNAWIGVSENVYQLLVEKLSKLKYIKVHWTEVNSNVVLMDMIDFFDLVKPDDIIKILGK